MTFTLPYSKDNLPKQLFINNEVPILFTTMALY